MISCPTKVLPREEPSAPSFEAAMKKYGVDHRMIVGEGMFHCYPVFPIVKEAKGGWDLMVRLMKEAI